jgi:DNA gyrase/topoisomerase IV subunit B
MNTRGETIKKINENKEINDIKKILGLENGKEYHTIDDVHKCLRYSKIVLMVDQDLDGSHIKGLFINLFQSEWSSLTKIPGFISFMNTPLLKATLGKTTIPFYNIGEYKSAIVSLRNVVNDFPEIAQREEIDFLILKSSYLLAENSIPEKQIERFQGTITAFEEFTEYYTESSKYMNSAKQIKDKAITALNKINKQK